MSHLSDPWAWVMIWASISGYPSTFLGIHPLPAQQQPHKLCSSVWDGVFFFSFSSTALSFYMNGNTIFCSPSQKTWHSYSRPYCISRCCRRTTPAAEHWRASQKDDSSAFVLILNTHRRTFLYVCARVSAWCISKGVCRRSGCVKRGALQSGLVSESSFSHTVSAACWCIHWQENEWIRQLTFPAVIPLTSPRALMYWNDLDVNGGVSHLIQREAALGDYRL